MVVKKDVVEAELFDGQADPTNGVWAASQLDLRVNDSDLHFSSMLGPRVETRLNRST
jgi:hypothetical protein